MKKKKGFTLVELLVVIAIIGLLSTLAFVSLNAARGKARDAKRVSDVKQIQSALELFYNNQTTPRYPADLGLGAIGDTDLTTLLVSVATNIPIAPTTAETGCTDVNNLYTYFSFDTGLHLVHCDVGSDCDGYTIEYCLGGATGGINSGVNPACESGIDC